jgi:hypothetical protein
MGWSYIGQMIFDGDPPETYTAIVLVCCAFISSLGGVIQIARKESPGLMGKPFRGFVPILTGSLWVGICWFLILLIGYYRLGIQ